MPMSGLSVGVALIKREGNDGCRDRGSPHIDRQLGAHLRVLWVDVGHCDGVAEGGAESPAGDLADDSTVGVKNRVVTAARPAPLRAETDKHAGALRRANL